MLLGGMLFEKAFDLLHELIAGRAVKQAVVECNREVYHRANGNGIVNHDHAFWMAPVPMIADCGWLMTGVPKSDPKMP